MWEGALGTSSGRWSSRRMGENMVLRTYRYTEPFQGSNLNTRCVDVRKYGDLLGPQVPFIFLIQFQDQCETFYTTIWFNITSLITPVVMFCFFSWFSLVNSIILPYWLVDQWCCSGVFLICGFVTGFCGLAALPEPQPSSALYPSDPCNRLQDKKKKFSCQEIKPGQLYKWTAFLKSVVSWTQFQIVLR